VLVHREVPGFDAEPEEVLDDRQDDVGVPVVVLRTVRAVRGHDPEGFELADPVAIDAGRRRHLLDRHLQSRRSLGDLRCRTGFLLLLGGGCTVGIDILLG